MTIPLVVGLVIALMALAFVLYPLFADGDMTMAPAPSRSPRDVREDPVAALREIEFDRETGKLSDTDYDALKSRYTSQALAEMRARDAAASRMDEVLAEAARTPTLMPDAELDPAEAAVRRVRAKVTACPTCGPRPESDSLYCSDCGTYLLGACGDCGTPVTEAGARFCIGCGQTLAA